MTTIAYNHKDKMIAVDSQRTKGEMILTLSGNKSITIDGILFLMAGATADYNLLTDWYFGVNKTGAKPDCSAMVIESGKCYIYGFSDEVPFKELCDCNNAIGSGCDFAIAAMDFGESASGAVEYSKTRDIYTGGEVRTYKVE